MLQLLFSVLCFVLIFTSLDTAPKSTNLSETFHVKSQKAGVTGVVVAWVT